MLLMQHATLHDVRIDTDALIGSFPPLHSRL